MLFVKYFYQIVVLSLCIASCETYAKKICRGYKNDGSCRHYFIEEYFENIEQANTACNQFLTSLGYSEPNCIKDVAYGSDSPE